MNILNYLVTLFRYQEKNTGTKWSGCASSSNIVHELSVHLGADHEEAPNGRTNDEDSSITGCEFDIPSVRNSYSSKLISERKPNLNM